MKNLKSAALLLVLVSGFLVFAGTALAEDVVLGVSQIAAIKTLASADGTYANGWSWIFDVTAPTDETILNMKFADWVNGSNVITAANHIRFYSVQSSNAYDQSHAITISAADTYSAGMDLTGDLNQTQAGRQIQIIVEVMIPAGSAGGSYSTSYGIQTNSSSALSDDATVTSAVYTVSDLSVGFGTISNVPFATAKAVFESNLVKGQADQTWNYAGIEDPVTDANILVVTAQDGITKASYTIRVNADPDDVAEVAKAKAALPPELSPVYGTDTNVIIMAQAIVNANSSGVTVTMGSSDNQRVIYLNGNILYSPNSPQMSGNVIFALTKNSASDTKVVSVVVPSTIIIPSSNATVTSTVYTVSSLTNGAGTITNVPFGTSRTAFLAALVKGQANQTWNDSGITNPVTTGSALVVTAQDGITIATYTITVNPNPDDVLQVANAKAALPDAISLMNGLVMDRNIITLMQATVNGASSGVVVTISSTNNSRIGIDGTVYYYPPDSLFSGNVTFALTKDSASDTKDILVTVITPL